MTLSIAGIGTALPQHWIDQRDAAEIVKTVACSTEEHERLLPVLYRRSSVRRRHSILLERSDGPLEGRQSFFPPRQGEDDYGPTTRARLREYECRAAELALAAAASALDQARVEAQQVTHLVTVSCSGFAAPGFDVALIKQLQLDPETARTHVGFMGCHGAMNGLRVARAFVEADPNACVLLCATELCSLHHRYGWDPEQIVANAIFSDGAAALVAVPSERSTNSAWAVAASGSMLFPDSEDAMTWRIGDHGFEMALSARVPDLIAQNLGPWLIDWLARHGLSLAQVGSWAIHPGGPRILASIGEALGLSRDQMEHSYEVLSNCGNMSSPTVLFILDRVRCAGGKLPCVALAFGPGLCVEATLFR